MPVSAVARHLVVNRLIASAVVPSSWRWRMLRAAGFAVDRCRVMDGVAIHGRRLRLGPGAFVNRNCFVDATDDVILEPNAMVGMDCLLLSSSHRIGPSGRRVGEGTRAPVVIGEGAWVGARVTVTPGVRIGRGAVVLPGAVVTGDLEADAVHGGVPARLVRRLDPDDTAAPGASSARSVSSGA